MRPEDILYFWFTECQPSHWFKKDLTFDNLLRRKFGYLLSVAATGELFEWRNTARGRLAEIIILDQFSRNIFRDTCQMFATDPMSLTLAQEMVSRGDDKALPPRMRAFAYMPYMHSESKVVHAEALKLFIDLGLESNLEYEIRHKEIIDRFGRYPHRNALLGRKSSKEELEFLMQPASSF